MGVTHATTGATVWVAGCLAAQHVGVDPSLTAVIVGAVVCAAGALVPDFDHPRSLASTGLWPLAAGMLVWAAYCWVAHQAGWPVLIALALVALFPAVLTRAVSRLVYRATSTRKDQQHGDAGTHRALTHTWPFAVAVGLAAALVLFLAGLRWPGMAGWWWVGLPLGVGTLVHTLGDACTKSGVPLLWPAVSQGRRWRRVGAPLRFSTNSRAERVVLAVAFVAGLAGLFLLLPLVTHQPVEHSTLPR